MGFEQNTTVTKARMFSNNAYALNSYNHTEKLQSNNLKPDEKKFALDGWKFTFPDFLPDGFNMTTANHDVREEGNGGLNTLSLYTKNPETGVLEPPKRTFCFTA